VFLLHLQDQACLYVKVLMQIPLDLRVIQVIEITFFLLFTIIFTCTTETFSLSKLLC
jgi:hypothetical protein